MSHQLKPDSRGAGKTSKKGEGNTISENYMLQENVRAYIDRDVWYEHSEVERTKETTCTYSMMIFTISWISQTMTDCGLDFIILAEGYTVLIVYLAVVALAAMIGSTGKSII
ncbi:hypothetical protein ACJX0J_022764 [Zea mays]